MFTRTLAMSAMLAISSVATAASVNNALPARIMQMDSYTTFGNGDIGLKLDQPVGTCVGVWLKATDPGFKQNASVLLAAYMSNTNIRVWADDSLAARWTASSDPWCKIDSIRLNR